MIKKLIFIFFLLLFSSSRVDALELQSPLYKIETDKVNVDIQQSIQTSYALKSVLGEKAFTDFENKGYFIDNLNEKNSIKFTVSNSLINLNPSGKTDLSVYTDNGLPYQLIMTEEYPLKNSAGDTLSELNYRVGTNKVWFNLPNQNIGASPIVLISSDGSDQTKNLSLNFNLNETGRSEGTFESVLDLILTPGI